MSLERGGILAKSLQNKSSLSLRIKDHSPSMSLGLPTKNDLVPRLPTKNDDRPFELLRYPYMLPSITIRPYACPFTSKGYHYLSTNGKDIPIPKGEGK